MFLAAAAAASSGEAILSSSSGERSRPEAAEHASKTSASGQGLSSQLLAPAAVQLARVRRRDSSATIAASPRWEIKQWVADILKNYLRNHRAAAQSKLLWRLARRRLTDNRRQTIDYSEANMVFVAA